MDPLGYEKQKRIKQKGSKNTKMDPLDKNPTTPPMETPTETPLGALKRGFDMTSQRVLG